MKPYPAVFVFYENFVRFFFIVSVACHKRGTVYADFAVGVRRQNLAGAGIDNAESVAGQRFADTAGLVAVTRCETYGAETFGQAVALYDFDSRARLLKIIV